MKILIIGASRGVGKSLLAQALSANHQVAVLARDPAKLQSANPGVEVLRGDITDGDAVRRAVRNREAVCVSIGISPTFKRVEVFSIGAKNVVAAMHASSIKRLISVTGIGAGDSRGHGGFFYDRIIRPSLLRTIYADKDREEAVIKNSDLDWIIVRPGFLIDGEVTANYRALSNLDGVVAGKISRADVAHFMLQNSTSAEFLRRAPLLTY